VPIIDSPELRRDQTEVMLTESFVMLHRSLTSALKHSEILKPAQEKLSLTEVIVKAVLKL
jgi:hypothetical protein